MILAAPRAQGDPGQIDRATHAAALSAWTKCFPAGSTAPSFPALPDEVEARLPFEAVRTATVFRLEEGWSGDGLHAAHGGREIEFEPRGCRAVWVDWATSDGALATTANVGWINRERPTETELTRLVAAPARPSDPAHGFARAWLTHACPGGVYSELQWTRAIEGPLAPSQPWFGGDPRITHPTFWSLSELASVKANPAFWRMTDGNDKSVTPVQGEREVVGIKVPGVGPPTRTFTALNVDIFEAELPGRNLGRAIALRDRASNRHRWVVVTRGCIQGTTVKWVGVVGAKIVGVTHSRHPAHAEGDAVLIIDVPSGTGWAIRFPEAVRDRLLLGGRGQVRASLRGTRLSLRLREITSTINLAPLLALIPR